MPLSSRQDQDTSLSSWKRGFESRQGHSVEEQLRSHLNVRDDRTFTGAPACNHKRLTNNQQVKIQLLAQHALRPTGRKTLSQPLEHSERRIGGSREETMATDVADFGHDDMAAFLTFPVQVPRRGNTVEATVLSVSKAGAIVTFGTKSDAFVPAKHLGDEPLKPGQRASFVVHQSCDEDEAVELTRLWHDLGRHCEAGTTVTVRVLDAVKRGGTIVGLRAKYKELTGFIPASLMGGASADALVGTSVAVKVADAGASTHRLILDRRRVVEEQKMQAMKPGDILTGTVKAIATRDDGAEFGLFVDAGGASGLVHKSELPAVSKSLSERYRPGQQVQVLVLAITDRQRGRKSLSLSIKRLARDRFLAELQPGDTINGVIVKQADYGVFIRICDEGELNGLLHHSQMPSAVRSGRRPLTVGESVTVKVVSVDRSAGRISLSMRDTPVS